MHVHAPRLPRADPPSQVASPRPVAALRLRVRRVLGPTPQHDEFVHGKGRGSPSSPGDRWQQLATLRSACSRWQWCSQTVADGFMGAELAEDASCRASARSMNLRVRPGHGAVSAASSGLEPGRRGVSRSGADDRDPSSWQCAPNDHETQSILTFIRRAGPVPYWTLDRRGGELTRPDRSTGSASALPDAGRWRSGARHRRRSQLRRQRVCAARPGHGRRRPHPVAGPAVLRGHPGAAARRVTLYRGRIAVRAPVSLRPWNPTSPPYGVVTTCYRHPDRRAGVTCQRCERPICPSCMVSASVGFQCPSAPTPGPRISGSSTCGAAPQPRRWSPTA